MNLTLTVLNITAPVFALAAVGFIWVRMGFEYRVEFVTRLAMTLAVPCLVFAALMQADVEPAALAELSVATVLAYVAVGLVFWAVVWALGLDLRTYVAPLTFGNTGNLGLPLALFAFGEVGLGYGVVIFAIMAILSFTIGLWVVAGAGSFTRVIREPLVAASVLGVLFLWQGWQTPQVLTNTIELIGQMGIPLMLITLGVAVARLQIKAFGPAIGLALIKVVICASVGWGVVVWFDLERVAAAVLIVQLATPVGVTSYLLAEKYGADAQPVAGMVVVSTLLSVVTLPLILSFVI